MSLKIVAFSDIHEQFEKIPKMPDGDVLVCAGDITYRGSLEVIERFADWMKKFPHKYKVIVFGNHETFKRFGGDEEPLALKIIEEAGLTLLKNSGIDIDGTYFWGSPATPQFGNWAYMYKRGEPAVKQWAQIPDDTSVLITHGPAFGILDDAPRGRGKFEKVGCEALLDRIWELKKLKAHCFGHIHNSYGVREIEGVKFANVAICNEDYEPVNQPQVIEI